MLSHIIQCSGSSSRPISVCVLQQHVNFTPKQLVCVQKNHSKSNRLRVDFQVGHRQLDSKNDPQYDEYPEVNMPITTIQMLDHLPFLSLVTIIKPPLYPRLFKIIEVCAYVYNVQTSKSYFQIMGYQYFIDK